MTRRVRASELDAMRQRAERAERERDELKAAQRQGGEAVAYVDQNYGIQRCGEGIDLPIGAKLYTAPQPAVPEHIRRILMAAVEVAADRGGDTQGDDGSYATTPVDYMIELESAIADAFSDDSDDVESVVAMQKIEAMPQPQPDWAPWQLFEEVISPAILKYAEGEYELIVRRAWDDVRRAILESSEPPEDAT